jgi:hypothetical protein
MSTKSALRADLGAEDRKTLAEDRKRMEKLGKGSQLDDWLAFGPGLLIRRRLAKNIAGLAESDPAKGHRYSRAFKQQMEMDGLYDRTTKSDLMKSTFTGDGFSPNALTRPCFSFGHAGPAGWIASFIILDWPSAAGRQRTSPSV